MKYENQVDGPIWLLKKIKDSLYRLAVQKEERAYFGSQQNFVVTHEFN